MSNELQIYKLHVDKRWENNLFHSRLLKWKLVWEIYIVTHVDSCIFKTILDASEQINFWDNLEHATAGHFNGSFVAEQTHSSLVDEDNTYVLKRSLKHYCFEFDTSMFTAYR